MKAPLRNRREYFAEESMRKSIFTNKATPQGKDPKRQGLADRQTDRLRGPRTVKTKLSLAVSGHLLQGTMSLCAARLDFSHTSLELLVTGCCVEPGLGKGEPLSPGRSTPPRGSTALEAGGQGLSPTVQELQILLGQSHQRPGPAGTQIFPQQAEQEPLQ